MIVTGGSREIGPAAADALASKHRMAAQDIAVVAKGCALQPYVARPAGVF